MKNLYLFCFLGIAAMGKAQPYRVTLHQYAEPEYLNPITATNINSYPILYNIFGQLLEYHPQKLTLMPQTAAKRPVVTKVKSGAYNGGMSLSYEIRPEATWDNGDPITAYDYVFTLKVLFNPHIAASVPLSQYQFIDSIYIEENPRRFTIFSKTVNFLAESSTGELMILPEYRYDPQKSLRAYPLRRLIHPADKMELFREEPLAVFAEAFQQGNNPRNEAVVVEGSGPYKLNKWVPGKGILLERKENWWGDKIVNDSLFLAYPTQLYYKTIPYYDAAVMALVNGEIDMMHGIKPQTFAEMQKTPEIADKMQFFAPNQLAYHYIAFNLKNPKLADRNVREALAHLLDREDMIKNIFYGAAQIINSPVNPNKPHYNTNLKPLAFSPEMAASLLDKAGWKDSDKDGIRDKKIEGQKVQLSLEYKYNKGNNTRRDIGLVLQEQAQKVGIDIKLVEIEWMAFMDDLSKNKFEMYSMAWMQGHGLDDLRPIWHSESISNGGSNRFGFSSPKVDAAIESIENELEESNRIQQYRVVQEVISTEVPCIFLATPKQCIAANSKLLQVFPTILRPGYQERFFKVR